MLLDSNIVIYAFQPKYRDTDFERFLEQGNFSASNLTRLEVMGYWRNSDIEFKKFAEFLTPYGFLRCLTTSSNKLSTFAANAVWVWLMQLLQQRL